MTAPSPFKTTATLLIESAQNKLEPRSIGADTTIGRDRRNTVMIDHPTVSRSHARIYRDQSGWHFVDLGSQNGSKLGETRARTASALKDGAELRIGRVRAWFFADAVPTGWSPPNAPGLAGKLIRCTCGHIGWAPATAGDGLLRCTACGKEIMRRDPMPQPTPIATAPADCAACHTTIAVGEAMHTCTVCAATMHAGCWKENRGCATYGCSQVGALDAGAHAESGGHTQAATEATARPTEHSDEPDRPAAVSDSFKQSLMAVLAFAAAGLVTFGVAPVAYGAWRLVTEDHHAEGRRRYVWAIISFAAGVVGFACSARWWLGMHL